MFKTKLARFSALTGTVALLGGCATAMPSGTGPDGNASLTIMGPTPMSVMQKAGETCPTGYGIASKMIQAGFNYSMTIECKERASALASDLGAKSSTPAGSVACPTGYTCTPVAKPKCPTGYTCVPN